jgi:hypothetical protein
MGENIRDGLTDDETRTALRYIRRRGPKLDALAEARTKKRAADSGGEQ